MAAKKPRKAEAQTPSLALSLGGGAKPSPTSRRPPTEPLAAVEASASGVKEPEAPALPDAVTRAQAIYRVALEQKDAATLLRLAEALHPETFGGLCEADPVKAARPESPDA